MKVQIANKDITIHNVPLEGFKCESHSISIEFDDENEKRWRIEFSPIQAIKITTDDCFDYLSNTADGYIISRQLCEVIDSDWIKELDFNLKEHDSVADFLNKSHHYILPLGDNVVEVVAWSYTLEEV
jgi:hypothetical protein